MRVSGSRIKKARCGTLGEENNEHMEHDQRVRPKNVYAAYMRVSFCCDTRWHAINVSSEAVTAFELSYPLTGSVILGVLP